jgi:hypothetical protein
MVRERRALRPQQKRKSESIWDSPKVKALLDQPLGTPVNLDDFTDDEKRQLAIGAFGRGKGRWPSGVEYVKKVRHVWKGLAKRRDG